MANSDIIIRDATWQKKDVERQHRRRGREFEQRKKEALAKVFSENGSIEDPFKPVHILVHRWGRSESRESVFRAGFTVVAGDWVRIGYDPKPLDRWKVIGLFDGDLSISDQYNYESHTGSAGGVGPPVQQQSINIFRTTGNGSNLTIAVQPLIYRYNDQYKRFNGKEIDLSSHVPGVSGQIRNVLTYLDKISGALKTLDGSVVPSGSTPPFPDYPDSSIPSAYVQLSGGQTSISTDDHVTDARPLLGEDDVLGALSTLSDVDLTGILDGQIISYDAATGKWFPDTNSATIGHPLTLDNSTILAISAGAVTATTDYHVIAAETGTADDLDTITAADNRQILVIQADAGDTITVKHGTGNIFLNGAADASLSGNETLLLFHDGTNWADVSVTGAGGSGDVTGPASSTDNAIARFNGTGGKTIQNSGVTVDDNNIITAAGLVLTGPAELDAEVVAASGATYAIDMNVANVFDVTLDQACTFSVTNPPASGTQGSFNLILHPAGFTPTMPAGWVWTGDSTITTTVGTHTIISVFTVDGGTTYFATLVGTGIS